MVLGARACVRAGVGQLERSNLLLARFRGATSWVPTYGSERPLDRVASSDVTQDMLVALKMMRVDVDIRMMRSP